MKPLTVSALCLAIAGCNAPPRDAGFVARAIDAAPVQSYALGQPDSPVPSEAMLLLPPEAGGVLRVRERHYRNGSRQEIVLAGGVAGENILDVSLRTSGGGNASRGELQIGKPSQRGIAAEAQARFPGMKMHVVTRPMSNMFGPFGLAIGRRGAERCVFAWQWIDDLRGSAAGSRSAFASALAGAMPASVRLRMCRTNMTLDEMASFMEGLRAMPAVVDSVARMDRRAMSAGFADPATPVYGGAAVGGALTSPLGGSLEAALPGAPVQTQRIAAAPPAPKVTSPKLTSPRVAAPAASAPRIAVPRVAAASKPGPARVTRAAPAPARPPVRYQFEPGPQPAGPRYLAPVDGAAAGRPGAVAAAGAYGATRLDASLPSRAYLGPSGQR